MSEPKKNDSSLQRFEPSLPDANQEAGDSALAAIIENVNKKLEEARISLRPEERKRVGHVIAEEVIEKIQFFSGPQPPPVLLAEYERICPGWAEKLLQMGVDEQLHRHKSEMRALDQKDQVISLDHRDATYAMTGLIFGFLALLVILGVGVYALSTGHIEVAVGCLGGSLIAAAVSVFVNGRTRRTPAIDTKSIDPRQTAKTPILRPKRKKR
jgi:uncharacterized membrane protein